MMRQRTLTFSPVHSYDDILIKPRKSVVKSRKDINVSIKLSKNIQLKIPIVSANMDTVTEEKMSIKWLYQVE